MSNPPVCFGQQLLGDEVEQVRCPKLDGRVCLIHAHAVAPFPGDKRMS